MQGMEGIVDKVDRVWRKMVLGSMEIEKEKNEEEKKC